MLEAVADLWTYPGADALCVTTNSQVNKAGRAIMGAGVAAQALARYSDINVFLADHLHVNGNVPGVLLFGPPDVVSFPTKYDWRDPSDLNLIMLSAYRLDRLATAHGWKIVVLPQPGCGEGRLYWSEVKPLIEPILDDRFVVVTR